MQRKLTESGKENISGTRVSKVGHGESLLGLEKTDHY